jgi:hypothetical protein
MKTQATHAELREHLLQLLKDELRISVTNGRFTSPNDRTIQVHLGNDLIAEATFDVADKEEYRDW